MTCANSAGIYGSRELPKKGRLVGLLSWSARWPNAAWRTFLQGCLHDIGLLQHTILHIGTVIVETIDGGGHKQRGPYGTNKGAYVCDMQRPAPLTPQSSSPN